MSDTIRIVEVNDNVTVVEDAVTVQAQVSTVVVQAGFNFSGGSQLPFNETPAGAVDGSNRTFTLSMNPSPSNSLLLFLNGLLLKQGQDFSLNGSTITMTQAPLPAPPQDDVLEATYNF